MLLSQARLDKLNAGIQNQIRAEAEKLKGRLPGGELPAGLTPDAKNAIVTATQPKIEAAFKETLDHFKKAPGSAAVHDMILGHVEAALAPAKPAPLPFPQNRG
jgi:hypothetical protein